MTSPEVRTVWGVFVGDGYECVSLESLWSSEEYARQEAQRKLVELKAEHDEFCKSCGRDFTRASIVSVSAIPVDWLWVKALEEVN